jgi:antitoxin ParD1/3/4
MAHVISPVEPENLCSLVKASTTMNIPVLETLKPFTDEYINQDRYGTSGEYVQELIRKDRLHLRDLLLAGAATAPAGPADDVYFDGLRNRMRASGSTVMARPS